MFIYEKLQFLDATLADSNEDMVKMETNQMEETLEEQVQDETVGTEQQVITDNQEYYEVIENIFSTHITCLGYVF